MNVEISTHVEFTTHEGSLKEGSILLSITGSKILPLKYALWIELGPKQSQTMIFA
jgi:hypothetical protein